MSDLAEFWKDSKEAFKDRCQKRNNKFEPELIEIGAVKKSSGVYEKDDWFCYPTKGFAMNKRNSRQRMSLTKFINQYKSPLMSL